MRHSAMKQAGSKPKRGAAPIDPLVCFCNRVPQSAIERAVQNGACTLAHVFDATWAGCGPCGGSCQPELQRLLDELLAKEPSHAPR